MPENRNRHTDDHRRAPAFSVHDEIKRNRRLRLNKKVRKVRSTTHKLVTAVLCLAVFLITTAAILLAVMRLQTVSVSGNLRYTSAEVISAAEVDGAILPFVSKASVEKRIMSACPYVNSIELKKSYPSSLEIVVTEARAVYTANVRGKQYSLDADLRIIDLTGNETDLIELALPEASSVVEGSKIEFYDSANNERIPKLLAEFFDDVNALPLTYLDLTSRFTITGTIGDSVKIIFGDYNDIPLKLKTAKRYIEMAEQEKSSRTLINVSTLTDGSKPPSITKDYEGEF